MIVIVGDSWGCGEWKPLQGPNKDQLRVTHFGLEQYLKDSGRNVKNLSGGNFQNDQAIKGLETYLNDNPSPTSIIWFVTCVLRSPLQHIDDPYEFGMYKLKTEFNYINQLAKKHNTKVYAIGGLCDLPPELIQTKFDNLLILIPSMSSLVLENFPQSMFGDSKELFKITPKQAALDVAYLIEKKLNTFQKSDFFPDHGHPDRRVHYKIFEIIKQYV